MMVAPALLLIQISPSDLALATPSFTVPLVFGWVFKKPTNSLPKRYVDNVQAIQDVDVQEAYSAGVVTYEEQIDT